MQKNRFPFRARTPVFIVSLKAKSGNEPFFLFKYYPYLYGHTLYKHQKWVKVH